jgi:hypothetical protein
MVSDRYGRTNHLIATLDSTGHHAGLEQGGLPVDMVSDRYCRTNHLIVTLDSTGHNAGLEQGAGIV